MNPLKQLAGQTAVYGLGTIVPRFLNYAILTPFYTRIFLDQSQYGIYTELYAYIAVFMVIMTYGMETGYFRFAARHKSPDLVFSTSLITLFVTSFFFLVVLLLFSGPTANLLGYGGNKEYIVWAGLIVAIDAFSAISFARLRRENRGLKFAMIKIVNVLTIIGLVFLFLYYLPSAIERNPEAPLSRIYNPDIGIGYVFIANLAGSLLSLLLLSREVFGIKFRFDIKLLKDILAYSFPLLIAGLAGILNESLDKILLKHLLPDQETALQQLGIYGANFKIAVFMTIFIQMFRYAAEPFFFAQAKEKHARKIYALVMKYFLLFTMLIFLGITMYIDVVKFFIGEKYRSALGIVPIVLMANLFYGIFVNLSVWYKINDLTKYGAVLTILGVFATVLINIIFIPVYGYMASAWGHLACYLIMVTGSFLLGRKHYKIPYETARLGVYFLIMLVIFFISRLYMDWNNLLELLLNTIMIAIFLLIIAWREPIKNEIMRYSTE